MLRAWFDSPGGLYLVNLALASLVTCALALLAARFARSQAAAAHAVLCAALALVLVSPVVAALAGWRQWGWLNVAPAMANEANVAIAADAAAADGIAQPAHNAAATRPPADSRILAWRPQPVPAVLAIWALGSALAAWRVLRGQRLVRKLRSSLRPVDCPRLLNLAREASRSVDVERDVPMYTSILAPGPLSLGMLRPAIVLPQGLDAVLGDEELLCVLIHEAAHVARRDAWTAACQRLAGVAFWWNPLVAAVHRGIDRTREQMCDDRVVSARGDGGPLAWALYKVARFCLERPAVAGAFTLMADDNEIAGRIARLAERNLSMTSRNRPRVLVACFVAVAVAATLVPVLRAEEEPKKKPQLSASPASFSGNKLSYNDGTADNRKSIGGNGEMMSFELPSDDAKVAGIRIHGSRYGMPQAPQEDFMIYFLSEDEQDTVATKKAPYSRFKRGDAGWVEVKFPKPVEVPRKFWVALDFRAAQTKGVYVSIDNSTDGSHSKIGLPGVESRPANVGGDWMIEVLLAK